MWAYSYTYLCLDMLIEINRHMLNDNATAPHTTFATDDLKY